MNLPITESILRGELRPHILQQSLAEDELTQLIRKSRRILQKRDLMELEFSINSLLRGLVDTADIYAEDKHIRDADIKARAKNIVNSDPKFRYINSEIVIDNVLALPQQNTPLHRFYNAILDAEVHRTKSALLYLHRAIQDVIFMRSTLKALFRTIKNLCKESQDWEEYRDIFDFIPIKLTHLYFSILNTYSDLLYSPDTSEYEDDFSDFVFEWKGEYPSEEEVSKYDEQCAKRIEIPTTLSPSMEVQNNKNQDVQTKPQKSKDKADTFLQIVGEYNFLDMDKIKMLGTDTKIHELVLKMLETPGHACAMLEYLQFYDWIKKQQRTKFTKGDYDTLCSKAIMGIEKSQAFHTVRMSLKQNNQNAEKYRAYAYIDVVKAEYEEILNS